MSGARPRTCPPKKCPAQPRKRRLRGTSPCRTWLGSDPRRVLSGRWSELGRKRFGMHDDERLRRPRERDVERAQALDSLGALGGDRGGLDEDDAIELEALSGFRRQRRERRGELVERGVRLCRQLGEELRRRDQRRASVTCRLG